MKKIKLLFDMDYVLSCIGKGTGIYKETTILLSYLAKSDTVEVYPVITSKNNDIIKYLKLHSLEWLQDKVVSMKELKSTTKCNGIFEKIMAYMLGIFCKIKYYKELQKYDGYMSTFNRVPPVIETCKNISTFLVVQDLIPVFFPTGYDRKFVNKFSKQMKRVDSDVFFSISDYTTKDLLKFRPDLSDRPIHKIYLGADSGFRPIKNPKVIKDVKDKYKIKADKYFLGVSELNPRKNFVHLLKSFVKFLEETKAEDIYLVLVGPIRKGYEDVTKQVANLDKYKEKIIQTGYVDEDDLAPLYNGALAFIYPSLYEGFGLPILEAMQCGTPVISANNSSLPEVGGDAVLYISGHNEKETASILAKVYQNKELRAELSAKSLARAKDFSWDKTAEILISTITQQCNKDN